MFQFVKNIFRAAKKRQLRKAFDKGTAISNFIAKDVEREIMILSVEEIDDGFITVRERTTNILYLSKGLEKRQPFGPAQRIAIDELWEWTGRSWGGLADGTSIADNSTLEIEHMENDA